MEASWMTFSRDDAVNQMGFVRNDKLFYAASMALTLYLDERWHYKQALDTAAEKYQFKPKKRIDELVRSVVPKEIFAYRRTRNFDMANQKKREKPAKKLGTRLSKAKSLSDVIKR